MVRIGPVVSEEKMTTHDDGRQPIAIGHLSDSGDLIKIFHANMLKRYVDRSKRDDFNRDIVGVAVIN